jgi:hypothetical protein
MNLELLSKEKLEKAFLYLYEPKSKYIPEGLSELTEIQWLLLDQILDNLLTEKDESTIH